MPPARARDLAYLIKAASDQLSEIASFDSREGIENALLCTEGISVTAKSIADKIQEAIEIIDSQVPEEAPRD